MKLNRHITAGLIAGGVLFSGLAFPSMTHAEVPDHRVWQFYYGKCTDGFVHRLVGMNKRRALATVDKMNLTSYRLLDPGEPVNFEVIPSRLTMVIGDNGIIQRAFCR